MQIIFSKLIDQLNGAVFVLIAILILAFWAMYKLGGVVDRFKHFNDKHKIFEDSIDIIKNKLSDIGATVKLIYDFHLDTVKNKSPITLTEKGERIDGDVKIQQKVNDHWADIEKLIEEKNPVNPYDIQSVSMDISKYIFDDIFNENEKNEIKTYAFNEGINLLQITPIVGVFIRDRYLKEKNIAVEEVDKHAPKK